MTGYLTNTAISFYLRSFEVIFITGTGCKLYNTRGFNSSLRFNRQLAANPFAHQGATFYHTPIF
jgi:hypothetical protein